MECAICGKWFLELTRCIDTPVGRNRVYERRYLCRQCFIAQEGDAWDDGIDDTPVLEQRGELMLIVRND